MPRLTSMSALRALRTLLSPEERRQGARLAALMLVGMVLETAGIGLVIPLVAVLVDPQAPMAARLLAWLGQPAPTTVLLAGLAGLLVFSAIKSAFLAWAHRRLNRFLYDVHAGLSYRLFETYLALPWPVFIRRNSGHLISHTVNDVALVVTQVVGPAATLVGEGVILLALLGLLATVEPAGTLAVLLLVTAGASVYLRVVGPRLVASGQTTQFHQAHRVQHIQQGLGGAREIRLLGREQEFLRQYATHNLGNARAGELHLTALQLPRLLLEPITAGALTVLVAVMAARGTPAPSIAAVVALFAAAALRLMPSANRLFAAWQSLRYGAPAAEQLCAELASRPATPPDTPAAAPLPFTRALTVEHVTVSYPGAPAPTLVDVSLTIQPGESVGIVGESGSGKSTLLDVLLGLLPPQGGCVRVDGMDIQRHLRAWQRQVGHVPQVTYLTDDTIRRNVAFGLAAADIDDARVWSALADAQLESFVRGLPAGLDTLVGERGLRLSGGQRQRIGIARALYDDPAVLVLDEPTSALDDTTERDVMAAVRGLQGRKTILLAAHRASTLSHCDRLYQLEAGRVIG